MMLLVPLMLLVYRLANNTPHTNVQGLKERLLEVSKD